MIGKKQILCLAVGLYALSTPLWGQSVETALAPFNADIATHYYIADNALGQVELLRSLPNLRIPLDRIPYYRAISTALLERKADPLVLQRFLEQFPSSTDRNRALLSIGKIDLARSNYAEAKYYLGQVRTVGLTEVEQVELAIALGLAELRQPEHKLSEEILNRIQLTLEQGIQRGSRLGRALDSYWLDEGRLHLALLYWHQGKVSEASKVLEQDGWEESLEQDVAYYRALLAYQTQTPSQAIALTQEAERYFPDLRERIPLRGAMAQAYFRLGDYQGAIRQLPTSDIEQLSAQDSYALGCSFFALGRTEEAIPLLSEASRSPKTIGAMAQLMLGSAKVRLGKTSEAVLAYTQASEHPAATTEVREQALYNSIVAYASSGTEMLGQNIRLAELFITTYPSSPKREEVMKQLQYFYTNSKDYELALSSMSRLEQKGISFVPTKQYLLLRWAERQREAGDRTAFRKTAEQAIGLGNKSPYYSQSLVLLASDALDTEDWKRAEGYARDAISLSDGKLWQGSIAQYILGYSLYNQRRYAEAITPFREFEQSNREIGLRADALCRIGDCLLAQNNKSSAAITSYTEADKLLPEGSDEAKIRLIELYRLRGEYEAQIKQIELLLRQHPQSTYIPEALYAKAKALGEQGKPLSEVDNIYQQIQTSFPQSSFASKSALERALLYFNQGNEAKAIDLYKDVIKTYPDREEAQTALSDLKAIYIEKGEASAYASYVESLGKGFALSGEETAHLQYLSLEERVRKETVTESELKDYLTRYPSTPDRLKVEQFLASYYIRTERKAEALGIYKSVLQNTNLTNSQRIQNGLTAARLSLELGHLNETEQLTTKLLSLPNLPTNTKQELILLQGKSLEQQGRATDALKTYKALEKDTDSPYGAEAYVRSAQIQFDAKGVQGAKKMLEELLQRGTPQQYWLARGVILLSDCADRLGEAYLAEQYLESLQANYQGKEADIQTMISERLTKYKKKS